tara:strand:+ start:1253 stop:1963 length:711 start_codon:yes stop_codon:yes gene_type:complete
MIYLQLPKAKNAISALIISVVMVVVFVLVVQGSPEILTPSLPGIGTQTLKLELFGRYSTVTLKEISVGKDSGLDYAFRMYADDGIQFEIESLQINDITCPGLNVTSTHVSELTLTDVVNDGISLGFTLTSTPDIVVGSLRGARTASLGGEDGQTADWAYVKAVQDTIIKTMVIDGFSGFGADCNIEGLEIGEAVIVGGRIGSGTGINTPDLVFETTVNVGTLVDVSGNTETSVKIR